MSNVNKSNCPNMDEAHKKTNLTSGGSNIVRSILRSHVKVIQITQKHFYENFEGVQ